jgi:hypothetical protein
MAWERMFEKRILKVRERELSYQWRNYVIEVRIPMTLLDNYSNRITPMGFRRSLMPPGEFS